MRSPLRRRGPGALGGGQLRKRCQLNTARRDRIANAPAREDTDLALRLGARRNPANIRGRMKVNLGGAFAYVFERRNDVVLVQMTALVEAGEPVRRFDSVLAHQPPRSPGERAKNYGLNYFARSVVAPEAQVRRDPLPRQADIRNLEFARQVDE